LTGEQIGLDAHLLSLRPGYRAAGVSHLIYHLLMHLPAASDALRYTAFLSEPCPELPAQIRQQVSALPTRQPLVRILWEQLVAPVAAWRQGIDLWHALVNVQPVLLPRPAIVTIPDLSYLLYPELFQRGKRLYNRLFGHWTARRARHIIAISQSTKEDIVRHYRVSPNKISVIYPGMDEGFYPVDDAAAARAFRMRKGLPEHIILFVGTIEPRKNLVRLLQAFAMLRPSGNLPHHLVIGGGKGWMYEQVFATVQELGLGDRVRFVGFIPQEELADWLRAADLFVYPSLFEGFGLPPLEALACGTPVIVSDISSLPEVVGEAALKVDPYRPEEMAAAMRRVLTDRALAAQLRAAGPQQAARFSWQRAAQETVSAYRYVLEQKV